MKDSWKKKFPVFRTDYGLFDEGKHGVRYMKQTFEEIMYTRTSEFQAISLPYLTEGLEMTVVMPKPQNLKGISSKSPLFVFETVSLTASKLKDIFGGLRKAKVNFRMPKFEIDTNLDLKEIFEKLGFGHVFSGAMSNYSE